VTCFGLVCCVGGWCAFGGWLFWRLFLWLFLFCVGGFVSVVGACVLWLRLWVWAGFASVLVGRFWVGVCGGFRVIGGG